MLCLNFTKNLNVKQTHVAGTNSQRLEDSVLRWRGVHMDMSAALSRKMTGKLSRAFQTRPSCLISKNLIPDT